MLLAGDIGATKSNLAIYDREAGFRAPLFKSTLTSADFPSLESLIRSFLAGVGVTVERACLAVAGPVIDDRATITNLGWEITKDQLRTALGLSFLALINDLEAIGQGIALLCREELFTLHQGQPVPYGVRTLIAPGTGLGEAFLLWDGHRYCTHPSEGGHCDFAPTDDLQIGLLQYLQRDHDHVSAELVCSGLGIPNIYAYLRDTGFASEPPALREQLAAAEDATPVIVQHGLDLQPQYPLCVATVRTFVSILGAEAGNQALKALATGGVFLGGGIPPRLLAALQENGRFLKAFQSKGRLSGLMRRLPVYVILNPDVGLLGAAAEGWERKDD